MTAPRSEFVRSRRGREIWISKRDPSTGLHKDLATERHPSSKDSAKSKKREERQPSEEPRIRVIEIRNPTRNASRSRSKSKAKGGDTSAVPVSTAEATPVPALTPAPVPAPTSSPDATIPHSGPAIAPGGGILFGGQPWGEEHISAKAVTMARDAAVASKKNSHQASRAASSRHGSSESSSGSGSGSEAATGSIPSGASGASEAV